jgi:hypothetical protein
MGKKVRPDPVLSKLMGGLATQAEMEEARAVFREAVGLDPNVFYPSPSAISLIEQRRAHLEKRRRPRKVA